MSTEERVTGEHVSSQASEHGERVSYRDKLVQALKLAFAALMGNKETTTAGPLTYENLADAALAVRDVELDRLSQENDRLAAELEDLRSSVRIIADRLTDWCHDDTASKVIAGSIAGDLNALGETKDGHR